jgi:hypothetical protein
VIHGHNHTWNRGYLVEKQFCFYDEGNMIPDSTPGALAVRVVLNENLHNGVLEMKYFKIGSDVSHVMSRTFSTQQLFLPNKDSLFTLTDEKGSICYVPHAAIKGCGLHHAYPELNFDNCQYRLEHNATHIAFRWGPTGAYIGAHRADDIYCITPMSFSPQWFQYTLHKLGDGSEVIKLTFFVQESRRSFDVCVIVIWGHTLLGLCPGDNDYTRWLNASVAEVPSNMKCTGTENRLNINGKWRDLAGDFISITQTGSDFQLSWSNGRPGATGSFITPTTLMINFPDAGTHHAQIFNNELVIQYPNGQWLKVIDLTGRWEDPAGTFITITQFGSSFSGVWSNGRPDAQGSFITDFQVSVHFPDAEVTLLATIPNDRTLQYASGQWQKRT